MNDYSIRQQNRMVNATAFLKKYEADWPANSRPVAALTRLPEIIERITQVGAEQGGGERQQKGGTQTKSGILTEVKDDAKAIERTARVIGEEEDAPAFAAKFMRPSSNAAERVIQGATDVLALLQDDATWAKFTAEGMRADLRAELAADLEAYPNARDDQAAGRLNETGATDELAALVKEGAALIDKLDVFFGNFLSHDKVKLAEWKTASRLERAAVRTPVEAKI